MNKRTVNLLVGIVIGLCIAGLYVTRLEGCQGPNVERRCVD